jgi:hypothetical protein
MMMIAMPWSVETLNDTVDAELAELPPDMRRASSGWRS